LAKLVPSFAGRTVSRGQRNGSPCPYSIFPKPDLIRPFQFEIPSIRVVSVSAIYTRVIRISLEILTSAFRIVQLSSKYLLHFPPLDPFHFSSSLLFTSSETSFAVTMTTKTWAIICPGASLSVTFVLFVPQLQRVKSIRVQGAGYCVAVLVICGTFVLNSR
jgi:hypothetical protein